MVSPPTDPFTSSSNSSTVPSPACSFVDVAFRQSVIKKSSDYVTTLSKVLFTDFETIVFLKKEVMTVLSNTGLKGQNYTVTIPMPSTWKSGTEFTDIIGCGKVKVASTGDFVTNIVNGMPQVSLPFRPWSVR